MDILISVIIPDHNRKDYVKDAVNSVLNQTFDMRQVEILVIKNYKDEEIDGFLEGNRVRSIFTEKKSLGEKLALGIEQSKGTFLAFLDDDDEFEDGKLVAVRDAFSDGSVAFYHNSINFVTEDGNIIGEGLSQNIPVTLIRNSLNFKSYFRLVKKYKLDWYMSSIAARKSILLPHIQFIRSIDTSLDKTILFLCASSGDDLFFDSNTLTRYRVHRSKMNMITELEDYIRVREEFYLKSKVTVELLGSYLHKGPMSVMLRLEKFHSHLLTYFFSDADSEKVSSGRLIAGIFENVYYGVGVTVKWCIACLVRKIYKKGIRKRLYNSTMKEFRRFGLN